MSPRDELRAGPVRLARCARRRGAEVDAAQRRGLGGGAQPGGQSPSRSARGRRPAAWRAILSHPRSSTPRVGNRSAREEIPEGRVARELAVRVMAGETVARGITRRGLLRERSEERLAHDRWLGAAVTGLSPRERAAARIRGSTSAPQARPRACEHMPVVQEKDMPAAARSKASPHERRVRPCACRTRAGSSSPAKSQLVQHGIEQRVCAARGGRKKRGGRP